MTSESNTTTTRQPWPRKFDLFGVRVSATSYSELVEHVLSAAQAGRGGTLDFMPVHGLVTAAQDKSYRDKINCFDVVATDGQPVRWAMNFFHNTRLADRVYGPHFMWHVCKAAEARNVSVYLYGSTDDVLVALVAKMHKDFPNLKIAAVVSPPFRPLTPAEDAAQTRQFNESGAGIVFIGTGCPRQEVFAYDHRDTVRPVMLCVGAAFDFHAGTKKMAPLWMQKRGLEWLFRLTQEPGRLWRRYLVTNSVFLFLVLKTMVARAFGRAPTAPRVTA